MAGRTRASSRGGPSRTGDGRGRRRPGPAQGSASVDSICPEKTRRANAARPFRGVADVENRSPAFACRRLAVQCIPAFGDEGPDRRRVDAGRGRRSAARRLRRPRRRAGRTAARAAGQRRAGGAAQHHRQRGVQRPPRSDRVRRAAAARLGHDRQGPLRRRRLGQEGRADVHDRPAPVRGRGRARAVAAGVDQGQARAGADASWRARRSCSTRRRCRSRRSTSWTSGSRTSQADIQGAEAALRVARLNLEYTQVRAPIAGRASRANITAGNLVNEQSVLTSIAGVSQVYAYFDGSEQTYLRLQGRASRRARRRRCGWRSPTSRASRTTASSTSSTTGSTRRPARSACARASTTPRASSRPACAAQAAHGRPDAVRRRARARPRDRHRPDQEVRLRRRRRRPAAVPRGQARRAASTACASCSGNVKAGENVVVDGLQRIIPGVPVAPQVLKVDAKGMPIFPPPPGAARRAPASAAKS